jgi:drug/metabolite transporter (DMT)-like permease
MNHSALSTQHSALRVHGALLLVAFLFSINYIISKLAMRAFNPLVFAYLRVVGAAVVLNAVTRERRPAPLSRRDAWHLAGFAVLGVVINQTFFLTGLHFTSADVAAILITAIPVFALGAALALGRERPTAAKVGGIALAAGGALLVVGREGFAGTTKSLIGDLFIIGNSLSYAFYLVLSKPMMARLSARRVVARMFGVACVLMLPACAFAIVHQDWSALRPADWWDLVFVIAGPTVAAYLINAWALRYADSSLVAAYTYLQPVFTILLAAIFLGEKLGPAVAAAAAMIFAGVYLSGRRAADNPV